MKKLLLAVWAVMLWCLYSTALFAAEGVVATIATGNTPYDVAVNPTTNKIYVANYFSANVTVINGGTQSITTVATGAQPGAIGVNSATNMIYVANYASNTVTVIDGATDTVATTITTGTTPYDIAVNPVTNKIYVPNSYSANITVIDGATNSTTTIAASPSPVRAAVNTVTNKIYVAHANSNIVTVIDGVTNGATAVLVGSSNTNSPNIAVNPVTNKIYVANTNDGTITAIDGSTNSTTTVPVGIQPSGIAVNSVTNKIYVANYASNSVTVIDGTSNSTLSVATGTSPSAVAVNPATNKIYVGNQSSNDVTVIDGSTNSTSTVAVGNLPARIAINPVTRLIYVLNYSSDTVSVIGAVASALTAITVTPANPTINVGQTQQFTATGKFSDGSIQVLTNNSPPPSGVVGLWPGDGNANDIVGTNNGTLMGGATFATGKIGQAFSFDGVDDYVSVPGTWGGGPEATIDAWVKTDAITTDFQAIVSSTAFEFVHLQLFNIGNIVAYTDGGVVFMPILPQTTTCDYRHIAFSVKSGDSRLYVDGQLVGSSPLTFNTIYPTSNLRIGSGYQGGRFFKGNIDQVEIFNRALSASEIQTIFNAGAGAGGCASHFTWGSSNTAVASIDTYGLASGSSPGVSTITATSGNISGSTTLTVVNPNRPPVANAGPDQTVIVSGTTTAVTLNGSGSSDPDNDALTYTWSGSFGTASGMNPVVTLPLGSHTITLTVSDGQASATDTVVIKVGYTFGGFLPPLTADSRTTFHLGSVIPVKFDLYNASGAAISTAVAYLSLQKFSGDEPVGDPINATPTSGADTGNQFRYSGGHYMYNLSTKTFSAGTWRIQATLDDGSVRTIDIGLTSK